MNSSWFGFSWFFIDYYGVLYHALYLFIANNLILEAPLGCKRFTGDFNTDNLMWSDGEPKYSVTCGMGDERFLSFDQIVAEPDISHPISTNVRQNGGANSCKIACNPGTIPQYPGTYFKTTPKSTCPNNSYRTYISLYFDKQIWAKWRCSKF